MPRSQNNLFKRRCIGLEVIIHFDLNTPLFWQLVRQSSICIIIHRTSLNLPPRSFKLRKYICFQKVFHNCPHTFSFKRSSNGLTTILHLDLYAHNQPLVQTFINPSFCKRLRTGMSLSCQVANPISRQVVIHWYTGNHISRQVVIHWYTGNHISRQVVIHWYTQGTTSADRLSSIDTQGT